MTPRHCSLVGTPCGKWHPIVEPQRCKRDHFVKPRRFFMGGFHRQQKGKTLWIMRIKFGFILNMSYKNQIIFAMLCNVMRYNT